MNGHCANRPLAGLHPVHSVMADNSRGCAPSAPSGRHREVPAAQTDPRSPL